MFGVGEHIGGPVSQSLVPSGKTVFTSMYSSKLVVRYMYINSALRLGETYDIFFCFPSVVAVPRDVCGERPSPVAPSVWSTDRDITFACCVCHFFFSTEKLNRQTDGAHGFTTRDRFRPPPLWTRVR